MPTKSTIVRDGFADTAIHANSQSRTTSIPRSKGEGIAGNPDQTGVNGYRRELSQSFQDSRKPATRPALTVNSSRKAVFNECR